jgi:hypothetical protein
MLELKTVTNGPIARKTQPVCHDTLPWLISFSLDDASSASKLYKTLITCAVFGRVILAV